MKTAIIAIPLLLICASFFAEPRDETAIPEGTEIREGFGTAEEYLKMSPNEKLAYAMGAMNGMLVAPIFGAPDARTKWFEDYRVGMNRVQVAAIITKFLKGHPGKWHQPLNALTYDAIADAYKKAYASSTQQRH